MNAHSVIKNHSFINIYSCASIHSCVHWYQRYFIKRNKATSGIMKLPLRPSFSTDGYWRFRHTTQRWQVYHDGDLRNDAPFDLQDCSNSTQKVQRRYPQAIGLFLYASIRPWSNFFSNTPSKRFTINIFMPYQPLHEVQLIPSTYSLLLLPQDLRSYCQTKNKTTSRGVVWPLPKWPYQEAKEKKSTKKHDAPMNHYKYLFNGWKVWFGSIEVRERERSYEVSLLDI